MIPEIQKEIGTVQNWVTLYLCFGYHFIPFGLKPPKIKVLYRDNWLKWIITVITFICLLNIERKCNTYNNHAFCLKLFFCQIFYFLIVSCLWLNAIAVYWHFITDNFFVYFRWKYFLMKKCLWRIAIDVFGNYLQFR